jgi:hypothetical protein
MIHFLLFWCHASSLHSYLCFVVLLAPGESAFEEGQFTWCYKRSLRSERANVHAFRMCCTTWLLN